MFIELGHGDVYIMSEKAVGKDYRKSSKLQLRHWAGHNLTYGNKGGRVDDV